VALGEVWVKAALAPIGPFYTAWYPSSGNPAPTALSRHVTVHQADLNHYTSGNAIAVAGERARGISSFRDLAAHSRLAGARWHGPQLRELGKPTLVMCGDADPVLRPRASRDTAAAIPGARLVILPGAGHMPPSATWPTIAQQMRALADATT
jgi:pimeloyl-ACP methyl ester carboxylesterase